jgi:hypothetical protein
MLGAQANAFLLVAQVLVAQVRAALVVRLLPVLQR